MIGMRIIRWNRWHYLTLSAKQHTLIDAVGPWSTFTVSEIALSLIVVVADGAVSTGSTYDIVLDSIAVSAISHAYRGEIYGQWLNINSGLCLHCCCCRLWWNVASYNNKSQTLRCQILSNQNINRRRLRRALGTWRDRTTCMRCIIF